MKLLLYGDFGVDTLATSYERAFRGLGHHVLRCDSRCENDFLPFWISNRTIQRLTINSLTLRGRAAKSWNQHFLNIVFSSLPDFVFVIKGDYLLPGSVQSIREHGIPIFGFHPDNPFRGNESSRPETIRAIPEFTTYYIWSKYLKACLEAAGARQVRYLPFGWDPEAFPVSAQGVDDPSNRKYEVTFIGGWDRHRDQWLAEVAKHFNLHIWGPPYWGTRGSKLVRPCWQGSALSGPSAAHVIRQSQICLNILRPQNLPDGTNMRTFEIPGCGGFAISTRTSCATEVLPEPSDGVYFSTVPELLQKIRAHVSSSPKTEGYAKRAHAIITSRHRYVDRAASIIENYRELTQQGARSGWS